MNKYVKQVEFHPSNYTELAISLVESDIMWRASHSYLVGMSVDDVAQELRLQLFRKMHRYDPRKAKFRNWANQVMNNRIRDLYRKSTYKNRDVLNDKNTSPIDWWIN